MYEGNEIVTVCYNGHRIRVDEELVGMQIECPVCGEAFLVAEAEPDEAPEERSRVTRAFMSFLLAGLLVTLAILALNIGWGWAMPLALIIGAFLLIRALGLISGRFDLWRWVLSEFAAMRKRYLKERLRIEIERNKREAERAERKKKP